MCRTAMVAGDEQRTLSVAGHHCPGSRLLPAIGGASNCDEVVWIWQFSQSRSRGHDGLVDDGHEQVEAISAVTLATRDMAASVSFYERLGFRLLNGGRGSSFSSFRAGGGYLNLQADEAWMPPEAVWGRVFFHVHDPDGHELSFARPLPEGSGDQ